MGAHSGRCFRQWRRTKARKARQGKPWEFPIRQKVPLALRPFLNATSGSQVRAGQMQMQQAILRYAQHQSMVGGIQKHSARGR